MGLAIERWVLVSVTSGTFGCHCSQRWRNKDIGRLVVGSEKHTVTATTSSPKRERGLDNPRR